MRRAKMKENDTLNRWYEEDVEITDVGWTGQKLMMGHEEEFWLTTQSKWTHIRINKNYTTSETINFELLILQLHVTILSLLFAVIITLIISAYFVVPPEFG